MKLCDRDLVFRKFIDLLSSCSNTAGNPDFANYPENPALISNPFRSRQTSIASGTSIFSGPKGRQERTYAYTCVCTYIAYVQNDKYRRRAFAHRSRPFSEERDKRRATWTSLSCNTIERKRQRREMKAPRGSRSKKRKRDGKGREQDGDSAGMQQK